MPSSGPEPIVGEESAEAEVGEVGEGSRSPFRAPPSDRSEAVSAVLDLGYALGSEVEKAKLGLSSPAFGLLTLLWMGTKVLIA